MRLLAFIPSRLPLAALFALLAAACGDDSASGAGATQGGGDVTGGGTSSGANGVGAGGVGGATNVGGGAASGGGTTTPECTGGAYDTCSSCCEALHPGGAALFAPQLQQCACGFGLCQFKCGAYCQGGSVDAACMENIAWNYNSPGYSNTAGGGNFGACATDPACAPYAECLMVCGVGRGPIPAPPSGTSPQDQCVHYINAYRAWEGKGPLARWSENEACVDGQIAHDAMTQPHDWFGMCGESGQNECYGFNPDQIGYCMSVMYSEKFSGDQGMGHFLTMTGDFSHVACGFSGSSAAQDYQ